jgi:two-component system, cell cycle response regulator DivK
MTEPPRPVILVVENDPLARYAYKALLERGALRVIEAGDGATGVEAAITLLPALIIMDLELPHMDGWTATRVLKSAARTRHVPVLVASGYRTGEAKKRAVEAGCDGYVPTPWQFDELMAEVRRLIAEAASAGDLAARGLQGHARHPQAD